MKFSLLPLLAVSFATAQNQNVCKDAGGQALETILQDKLSCYMSSNGASNQAASNGLDKCYDIAMKWCAGDGHNAEAYWKDTELYKNIMNNCPDELPSRGKQSFVNNLINKCPKAVNDYIRPTEGPSDDCEDVGRKLVRKLWRDESNSDCNQIFAFPNKVDDKLSRTRTSKCTRDAAKSELRKIQTNCMATQAPRTTQAPKSDDYYVWNNEGVDEKLLEVE